MNNTLFLPKHCFNCKFVYINTKFKGFCSGECYHTCKIRTAKSSIKKEFIINKDFMSSLEKIEKQKKIR